MLGLQQLWSDAKLNKRHIFETRISPHGSVWGGSECGNRISDFNFLQNSVPEAAKYYANVNTASFDYGVRPQLLSTEQTVVLPLVLSTVVNQVRRSESIVHDHHREQHLFTQCHVLLLSWDATRNGAKGLL